MSQTTSELLDDKDDPPWPCDICGEEIDVVCPIEHGDDFLEACSNCDGAIGTLIP